MKKKTNNIIELLVFQILLDTYIVDDDNHNNIGKLKIYKTQYGIVKVDKRSMC